MTVEFELEEFVQIVELGSISAAARELGRPRASLSRRLARLEESYGKKLLHREPHRQSTTRAGEILYQRARQIVEDLHEARRAVSGLDGVPRGVLRVGMPTSSGIELLLARPFLEAYPETSLEFVASHTHQDLIDHRIDVALRAGVIHDERLIGKKVIDFNSHIYASPSLLDRLGMPSLDTLGEYPCLLGFDDLARPITSWPTWRGASVPVTSLLRTNSMESRLQGVEEGLGLAMISERLVREQIRAGTIVPVLPDVIGFRTTVWLVWPGTPFMLPKVRAFVDLASELLDQMTTARDQC